MLEGRSGVEVVDVSGWGFFGWRVPRGRVPGDRGHVGRGLGGRRRAALGRGPPRRKTLHWSATAQHSVTTQSVRAHKPLIFQRLRDLQPHERNVSETMRLLTLYFFAWRSSEQPVRAPSFDPVPVG